MVHFTWKAYIFGVQLYFTCVGSLNLALFLQGWLLPKVRGSLHPVAVPKVLPLASRGQGRLHGEIAVYIAAVPHQGHLTCLPVGELAYVRTTRTPWLLGCLSNFISSELIQVVWQCYWWLLLHRLRECSIAKLPTSVIGVRAAICRKSIIAHYCS